MIMNTIADTIEKTIVINAPQDRVYRAVTDSAEFGSWFCNGVTGDFEIGEQPVIHEDKYGNFRLAIIAKDPITYFAYRWVSGTAFIPKGFEDDPLGHPNTLVEFFFEEAEGGTRVTVKESGFASLPDSYAAQNLEDNTGGWEYQLNALNEYLAK